MLFKIHICYFHNYATKRHRKNLIERVRDEDGVWRDLLKDIKMVMINYYKDLFSSTNLTGSQVVLDWVPSVITEDMNSFLSWEFEESEVATALQKNGTPQSARSRWNAPSILIALLGYSETRCYLIYSSMAKFRYLAFTLKSYLYSSFLKQTYLNMLTNTAQLVSIMCCIKSFLGFS